MSFTCSRMGNDRGVNMLAPSWKIGFFASAIAELLSMQILVGPSYTVCSSLSTFLNHIVRKTPDDAATYLASQVERVTIDCFFDDQEKVVFPIKNT